ncbi:MAG: aminoglycoside phosphotransferase family protein [Actinocatenispora sp.]
MVQLAASMIGTSLDVRHDHSWAHGESTVVEVSGSTGSAWIVKQVRDPATFAREVWALRAWAPRLGEGRAPSLIATDDDRAVLVMDKLPGESGTADTPDEYRQAGELIRRLHGAEATAPDPEYPARAAESVDRWVRRLPGIVDDGTLDFVRAQITLMTSLEPVRRGPVHDDNQPRNWMTDSAGVVRLIDFGKAKTDVQLRDFERMQHNEWRTGPELRDAFFDGYGRTLTRNEERMLSCVGAVSAVTTVLWARAHSDDAFEQQGWRVLARIRADVG